MNANRAAKREIVDGIKDKIQRASSFVIIDYKGLTVAEDTQLRNEFRKAEVEYKVLKNTLVKIALNELGYTDFDEALNGPTAIAFSYGDAIAPAKVAVSNIKKLNKMQVKCGMLDKKIRRRSNRTGVVESAEQRNTSGNASQRAAGSCQRPCGGAQRNSQKGSITNFKKEKLKWISKNLSKILKACPCLNLTTSLKLLKKNSA